MNCLPQGKMLGRPRASRRRAQCALQLEFSAGDIITYHFKPVWYCHENFIVTCKYLLPSRKQSILLEWLVNSFALSSSAINV